MADSQSPDLAQRFRFDWPHGYSEGVQIGSISAQVLSNGAVVGADPKLHNGGYDLLEGVQAEPFEDYVIAHMCNSLICGYGVTDAAIVGMGMQLLSQRSVSTNTLWPDRDADLAEAALASHFQAALHRILGSSEIGRRR